MSAAKVLLCSLLLISVVGIWMDLTDRDNKEIAQKARSLRRSLLPSVLAASGPLILREFGFESWNLLEGPPATRLLAALKYALLIFGLVGWLRFPKTVKDYLDAVRKHSNPK